MKIYTKTGDKGETGLFGGERVSKDCARVEAYGTVDELNAVLGVCVTQVHAPEVKELLEHIQNELFTVGCDLATPAGEKTKKMDIPRVSEALSRGLEEAIDRFDAGLPPLKKFILPGGSKGASSLHFARAVCRRAERRVVTLTHTADIGPHVVIYLNRLSDLLFVLARYENLAAGVAEVFWER